jgi:hypothetical protein
MKRNCTVSFLIPSLLKHFNCTEDCKTGFLQKTFYEILSSQSGAPSRSTSLQEYNNQTDKNHEIYAAAALLNPSLRRYYFERSWTGDAADQIEIMIEKNRSIWEAQYRGIRQYQLPRYLSHLSPHLSLRSAHHRPRGYQRTISSDISTPHQPTLRTGKQKSYSIGGCRQGYLSLRPWAFNVLSIPATSTELERTFSQARRMITSGRNSLVAAIFYQMSE